MNADSKKAKPLSAHLRLPAGPVFMENLDPDNTPGYPGDDKEDAERLSAELAPELSDLQERLYANGKINPETAPRLLFILQGLDTSGKGGVIRHAIGLVDPQGIQLTAFRAPTKEEREHDFLWRIRKAVPRPGMIGIFDRSQYEDVLIAKVDKLAADEEIQSRYEAINTFEKELADAGTVIVKCFLHISADEQRDRLLARLDDPSKHWKYNPNDLDTRAKWDEYMVAYDDVLERCNTDYAPWYVIPSNKKWYRNWAVAELLREHLASLDLDWPAATFDVAAEKKRLSG